MIYQWFYAAQYGFESHPLRQTKALDFVVKCSKIKGFMLFSAFEKERLANRQKQGFIGF